MRKPAKQIIPYTELLEKIQSLLVCYQECRNIHIDGITVHREQIDGANWNVIGHRHSGDDHDWPECRGKIVAEIRHLRECYDVVKDCQ